MPAIFSLKRFQHKAMMFWHQIQQYKSIQSFPEWLNTLQSSQSWWLHVLDQFWLHIPDEDCPLQGTNNSLNYSWLIFVSCQAFTPGGCYLQRDKYCPHILSSCLSHLNMGYNWTLQGKHRQMIENSWLWIKIYVTTFVQGLCIPRQSECPSLLMQEVCSNRDCPPDQYLCHPKVSFILISGHGQFLYPGLCPDDFPMQWRVSSNGGHSNQKQQQNKTNNIFNINNY